MPDVETHESLADRLLAMYVDLGVPARQRAVLEALRAHEAAIREQERDGFRARLRMLLARIDGALELVEDDHGTGSGDELTERLRVEAELEEAIADRLQELEQESKRLRSLIDRDRTGLASALNGVRRILKSFSWLGDDGAWGSYSCDERTVDTLRREFRALFDQAREVISRGLHESGLRADMAFHPSRGDALLELDELRATVVQLQNELAALRSCLDALHNGSRLASIASHEAHCHVPNEVAAERRKLDQTIARLRGG